MARSASDATRFTATIPTAHSKTSSSSSASSFTQNTIKHLGQGASPNESPQQKIARLRAAAAAARAGKESTFDRIHRAGRRWADIAHRVTAYSLIGFTVVSGVLGSFAITDMLLHNRRKRTEWLADQQAQHRLKLDEARRLLAAGEHISEDQMLLINQERAAQEAYEARKNKKGIFGQAKDKLFGAVDAEEERGGRLGVVRAVEDKMAEGREGVMGGVERMQQGVEKGMQRVQQGVEKVERKAEVVLDRRPNLGGMVGGPLDLEAQAVTNSVKETGKSWTDWVMRRS